MNQFQELTVAIGAYILGAVYLGGVIVAGLSWSNPRSVLLALTASGLGYCVQVAQVPEMKIPAPFIFGLWAITVLAALLGGLLLIIGG